MSNAYTDQWSRHLDIYEAADTKHVIVRSEQGKGVAVKKADAPEVARQLLKAAGVEARDIEGALRNMGELTAFKVPFHQPTNREDIRVGDTIRASYTLFGVTTDRTGIVALASDDHLSTAEDAYLWSGYWGGEFTFTLIDRPKPTLPSTGGSLIIVRGLPVEGAQETLVRFDSHVRSNWWTLDMQRQYSPETVERHDWRLAKVVKEIEL